MALRLRLAAIASVIGIGAGAVTLLVAKPTAPKPSTPVVVSAPVAASAPPPNVSTAKSAKGSVSPMFIPRDINHVLSTGQSLSVGVAGWPALSRSQPYANLMFSTGVIAGGSGLTALAPLVEGKVDGRGDDVETMSAAFANLVTQMARDELYAGQPGRSHDLLVSAHGVSGFPYSGLKKGTPAFAEGIAQVTAAARLAAGLGKSYVVRAVTTVHGETDHKEKNAAYARDLARWQADYANEVRAITGQSEPIPMLQTQMSSWTHYGQATSEIPAAQLAAHDASHGKIVLVGPKYHVEYSGDGVHLTSEGYRHMGEDYAKVYRHVVLEGRTWEPLRPIAVTRTGSVIVARFHVPVAPLVIDETRISDPGNYGFELAAAAGSPPSIVRVEVRSPDEIAITLGAEPTGPLRLRYAFTGNAGASAGATTGPRGNLRDSDATRSRSGHPLFNWCVHFDVAVP